MTALLVPEQDPAAFERLKRLGGNALLRQMLELFLTHAPARVEAAVAAGQTGNLDALSQAAHSLKSSAANVGAVMVQNLSQRLEQRAVAGDSASIPPLLEELQEAFARVKARLEDEWKGLSP